MAWPPHHLLDVTSGEGRVQGLLGLSVLEHPGANCFSFFKPPRNRRCGAQTVGDCDWEMPEGDQFRYIMSVDHHIQALVGFDVTTSSGSVR